MKIRHLLLAITFLPTTSPGQPADLSFPEKGRLVVLHLSSAPFPHPQRTEGHVYNQLFFSAKDHYSDNAVAVFIPENYAANGQVDIVVHFHGWYNNIDTVLARYRLIDQFVASGKNAILIVPQGPKNAPDSFGGKLEDQDGFAHFISEALDSLADRSLISTRRPGSIILSGHSGGYHVMSFILMHGGLTDHIKEVYLFDALYGQTEKFVHWLESEHGKMIDIYTEDGGTKEQSEQLVAEAAAWKIPYRSRVEQELLPGDLEAGGVIAIFTPLQHDQVVQAHSSFQTFLRASSLQQISVR